MTTAVIEKTGYKFKVGDILKASWGYDQTNIDFYKVTRRTEKTVTVVKVLLTVVEQTGFLSETVTTNGEVDYHDYDVYDENGERVWDGDRLAKKRVYAEPFNRKINVDGDGSEYGIRVDDCSWASLWSGRPTTQTHTH